MFSWLTNAWRVPELRRRLLFTAMILALYRLGSWIPVPGVDSAQIEEYFNSQDGTISYVSAGTNTVTVCRSGWTTAPTAIVCLGRSASSRLPIWT